MASFSEEINFERVFEQDILIIQNVINERPEKGLDLKNAWLAI